VKEPNMFHNYETEKISKASDMAENLQLLLSCSILLPEITMHDAFNVILWTSADHAWRSRVEELNNTL